jgi:hypothetical protein
MSDVGQPQEPAAADITNPGGDSRCSPDPCFKSAFGADMTLDEMQAEVNKNRQLVNDQRLQEVDGGPGAIPIYPETLLFPQSGGAAAAIDQYNNDPNSIRPTVAGKMTEDAVGLDKGAEAAGSVAGQAANRVPVIGPLISRPVRAVTTWGVKQAGSAVIDAGADKYFDTNPESGD